MSRKKKIISGNHGNAGEATANHRSFTMISSTETVPVALDQSPAPAPHDEYDSRDPKGSPQPGSPYQVEPVVVDRVPSSTLSSTSDLEGGSDKENEKKRGGGCCLVVAKFLLIFILVFCILFGLSYLMVGSVVESKPSLKTSQSFGLAGTYSLALGFVLLLVAIVGIMASLSTSKIPAIIFILLLVIHVTLHVVSTRQMAERITLLDQDASAFWDTLEDPTKLSVQRSLNCCGFEDPDDRAGPMCPESPDGGCAAHVRTAAEEISKGLYVGLYTALAVDAVLLILIVIIMLLNGRRK